MFQQFFGFSEIPFSSALDPDKLFRSDQFDELLKRFDYIVKNRGFMLLTGDPGTGKSSALRCLISTLNKQSFLPVYIPLSTVSPSDFYKQLNVSLSGTPAHYKAEVFRSIQSQIMSLVSVRNMIPVICFDEAHLFKDQNFNELQIIANFHVDSASPAVFILSGQSVLAERLRSRHLDSFFQRISLKFHLNAMTLSETKSYILHHLKICGIQESQSPLNAAAYEAVFNLSKGLPRLVGALMTKAFIFATSQKKKTINEEDILSISQEVI